MSRHQELLNEIKDSQKENRSAVDDLKERVHRYIQEVNRLIEEEERTGIFVNTGPARVHF